MFVTDCKNNRVRRVTLDGHVTTLAGTGTRGVRDGAAVSAWFNYPTGIASEGETLIVSDGSGHTLRIIGRTDDEMVKYLGILSDMRTLFTKRCVPAPERMRLVAKLEAAVKAWNADVAAACGRAASNGITGTQGMAGYESRDLVIITSNALRQGIEEATKLGMVVNVIAFTSLGQESAFGKNKRMAGLPVLRVADYDIAFQKLMYVEIQCAPALPLCCCVCRVYRLPCLHSQSAIFLMHRFRRRRSRAGTCRKHAGAPFRYFTGRHSVYPCLDDDAGVSFDAFGSPAAVAASADARAAAGKRLGSQRLSAYNDFAAKDPLVEKIKLLNGTNVGVNALIAVTNLKMLPQKSLRSNYNKYKMGQQPHFVSMQALRASEALPADPDAARLLLPVDDDDSDDNDADDAGAGEEENDASAEEAALEAAMARIAALAERCGASPRGGSDSAAGGAGARRAAAPPGAAVVRRRAARGRGGGARA
jgi:hypothetical protein